MVRKSTRVSNASVNSASKKRVNLSSESDFDGGDSSDSDFKNIKKGSRSKKRKVESSPSPDDEDDSDEEARPPKVTIIPLPKAREAGDIPYEDGRIHENTMLFLKDLKANNNREWMRCNVTRALRYGRLSDEKHGQSMMKIFGIRKRILLPSLNSFPSWLLRKILQFRSCRARTLYVEVPSLFDNP